GAEPMVSKDRWSARAHKQVPNSETSSLPIRKMPGKVLPWELASKALPMLSGSIGLVSWRGDLLSRTPLTGQRQPK
ncbi:hypothetical protein P7K49_005717, partial [Saguinus oedipus]